MAWEANLIVVPTKNINSNFPNAPKEIYIQKGGILETASGQSSGLLYPSGVSGSGTGYTRIAKLCNFISYPTFKKEYAIKLSDVMSKTSTSLLNIFELDLTFSNISETNNYTGVFCTQYTNNGKLFELYALDDTALTANRRTQYNKTDLRCGGASVTDINNTYLSFFVCENYPEFIYCCYHNGDGELLNTQGVTTGTTTVYSYVWKKTQDYKNFEMVFTDGVEENAKSDKYGEESGTGGYEGGSFDDTSDTIAIPDIPTIGLTSAGFVNVYAPSQNALAGIGNELFPEVGEVTDIVSAVTNMSTIIANAKLIDYVLDCHVIPVAPTVGAQEEIKVGYKSLTNTALKVTSDYVDFDCGTLSIPEYYANYIDYGAFTTAKLFLPFIGFVPVQNEYWQSGRLQVIYRFNVIDGNCIAFVKSTSSKSQLTDSVIGQYAGTACLHIPLQGVNYANMLQNVAQGSIGVASSVVSGNVGGAVSNAFDVALSAPSMQSSNNYSASSCFMGIRKPYLIIERTASSFSKTYPNEQGLPSNITKTFGDLQGFTVATVEHLDGFAGATKDELQMIQGALSSGVIF